MRAPDTPDWQPPDTDGISTAWLTDPNKSTLRGKRLRCAFDRPAPHLDTWPAAWRDVLAIWVKRADADKHYTCDALLKKAGASRANAALQLFQALLGEGLAEFEERRDPKLGWQRRSLRFVDPAALRTALGLREPDAAEKAWLVAQQTSFTRPDLEIARAALDAFPARTALARRELLDALDRWALAGRDTGAATRRDFAWFARGHTKQITDAEWRWLTDVVDLADYGIAAHAPLLLIAAHCRCETDNGTLDLAAVPEFIGLPPHAIHAIRRIHAAPARWLLIENRSAFEKAAADPAADETVVWLPGYPPGWWQTAIAALLKHAPAPAHIACDPDPDGIAIALQAGRIWEEAGASWSPWRMNAADLRQLRARRPLTERDRSLIESLRAQGLPATLEALAAEMIELGEKGEQESLFWDGKGAESRSSPRILR